MAHSFNQLLAFKQTEIQNGIIEGKTKLGYRVLIGSTQVNLKSAVPMELETGSRVLIAESDGELFIVGKEKLKTRQILEVVIHG